VGSIQFTTGGALGAVGTVAEVLEEPEGHSQEQAKISLSSLMASLSVIGSAPPVTPGASEVARAWEHIPPLMITRSSWELMGAGAPRAPGPF